MPLSSFISDLYNSLSITEVQAEAPAAEEKESHAQEEPKEEKEEKEEAEEPEKEEAAAAEEEKEEEEEEEEPEDPAPAITEECANSKECRPHKHHYDECVERVTAAASDNASGPKEDCVEEFFHVLHCATACAAPKIFAKLK